MTHPAYFDVFFAASMLAKRTEVLPDELCRRQDNTGLQAKRLLAELGRLWDERCLDALTREAAELDAASLIEW